jgi:hypothetical protein
LSLVFSLVDEMLYTLVFTFVFSLVVRAGHSRSDDCGPTLPFGVLASESPNDCNILPVRSVNAITREPSVLADVLMLQ